MQISAHLLHSSVAYTKRNALQQTTYCIRLSAKTLWYSSFSLFYGLSQQITDITVRDKYNYFGKTNIAVWLFPIISFL